MISPKLTGRLPEAVRRALMEASQIGAPDSLARRSAVDNTIRHARLRHPEYFKAEDIENGSIGCDQ